MSCHPRNVVGIVLEWPLSVSDSRFTRFLGELSARFDNWSPPDFRLSTTQIEDIIASLPGQVISERASIFRYLAWTGADASIVNGWITGPCRLAGKMLTTRPNGL